MGCGDNKEFGKRKGKMMSEREREREREREFLTTRIL